MKRGMILVLILVVSMMLFLPFLFTAEDEQVERGYDCLIEQVGEDCDSLSTTEKAFTFLAIDECGEELRDSNDSEYGCWPDGDCNLIETAHAIMALDFEGVPLENARDWLYNRD